MLQIRVHCDCLDRGRMSEGNGSPPPDSIPLRFDVREEPYISLLLDLVGNGLDVLEVLEENPTLVLFPDTQNKRPAASQIASRLVLPRDLRSEERVVDGLV